MVLQMMLHIAVMNNGVKVADQKKKKRWQKSLIKLRMFLKQILLFPFTISNVIFQNVHQIRLRKHGF